MRHRVQVSPLPDWLDADPLLCSGEWQFISEPEGRRAVADLDRRTAADLCARLRGVGVAGRALQVTVTPSIPRPWIRAARTDDARRRRSSTPGFDRAGTRLDDEGRWSLTPAAVAHEMGRISQARTVLDLTCGAGGNSIGFARTGARVTAIDNNAKRLQLARHNAQVYGVLDRITFLHGDALDHVDQHSPELLFIDPPWKTDWNRERTTLTDFPLLKRLVPRIPRPIRTWIKVPASFDPTEIPMARPEAWYGLSEGDRHRIKFVLLELSVDSWHSDPSDCTNDR